jgi:hypothetical protein
MMIEPLPEFDAIDLGRGRTCKKATFFPVADSASLKLSISAAVVC